MKNINAARAWEKATNAQSKGKYFLRLDVTGATARSRQSLRRACQLFAAELKNSYEVEIMISSPK